MSRQPSWRHALRPDLWWPQRHLHFNSRRSHSSGLSCRARSALAAAAYLTNTTGTLVGPKLGATIFRVFPPPDTDPYEQFGNAGAALWCGRTPGTGEHKHVKLRRIV